MKFEMFRCECGYKVLTPSKDPICDDCGKKMSLMTDEFERGRFDQQIKGVLKDVTEGKPVPRRHHD